MENQKIKNKIKNLVDKLKKYEYEYYALEDPSVSDFEYDLNLKELIELENKYPEFKMFDSPTNRVGGHLSSKFEKVKHSTPMLSLENAFNESDLVRFNNNVKKKIVDKNLSFVVEPKIDGLSLSITYKNGYLFKAVTRGDGQTGEDVTENVKTIKTVPLKIDFLEEIEVRGEAYISKKDFDLINSQQPIEKRFSTARNAASGSIRNLDSKVTASRNLSVLFYFIPNANIKYNLKSQYEVIEWLKKHNFKVSKDIKFAKDINEVIKLVEDMSLQKNNFKYYIDGAVIKVNEFNYYEEIGYTSKFPKWAIAYKFPSDVKETKLISIETTVGRTGKINYVANVEPIFIDGAKISKATLHNGEYIKDKNIMINDFVLIYKAGDIIPKIISPIIEKRDGSQFEFKLPKNCPSCKSLLVKNEKEVDLYCLNVDCVQKKIESLIHFCSRDAMNIDGLSSSIIEQLFVFGFITNFVDIYSLVDKQKAILNFRKSLNNDEKSDSFGLFSKSEFIDKKCDPKKWFKKKSLANLVESIEKSKKNSMERLIFGLGIKHVGLNTAKKISARFKNINNLLNVKKEDLENLDEIGLKISDSLLNWFNDQNNIRLINNLKLYGVNFNYINEYQNFKIAEKYKIYMNKTFTISGSFDIPRSKIKSIIETVFHSKLVSSITKKVDYIILGSNYVELKKQKAKSLNIIEVYESFWDFENE